jgi:PEP-CTERM motif
VKLKTTTACLAGLMIHLPSAWASSAPSQTYTVWQSGVASVATGQSYSANFDVGLFYNPATDLITNASLTLSFVGSDQRSPKPREVVTVINPQDRRLKDTYTIYDGPLDSVRVAIGANGGQTGLSSDSATLGSWTSAATWSSPVYDTYQQCSGLFVITCETIRYLAGYDHGYDRVDGFRGAFSSSIALDASSLAALAGTGLLRYGFTVNSGGAALESAMLTFTTAAVPEPTTASLSLAGAGLLLMAWRRRRLLEQGGGTTDCSPRA